MAKRKLTAKLKEQIKASPFRIKKSELAGEALKYLNIIRGARKAVKTKAQKAKYKLPKKHKEGAPPQVSDLFRAAAAQEGMSYKAYRKKHKAAIEEFEKTNRLFYNREIDQLKLDIKFLPKGRGVYVNGKRVTRIKADYYLTRVKGKIMSTGETYDRVNAEHYYDGKGNIHLNLPRPSDFPKEDEEDVLDFIQDNYPITFYRK